MMTSMFQLDLAFAAEIIAIVLSVFLLIKVGKQENKYASLGRFVGWTSFGLAIIALLCTTYYGTSYWAKGYFSVPHMMGAQSSMPMCRPMSRQSKAGNIRGRAMMGMTDMGEHMFRVNQYVEDSQRADDSK